MKDMGKKTISCCLSTPVRSLLNPNIYWWFELMDSFFSTRPLLRAIPFEIWDGYKIMLRRVPQTEQHDTKNQKFAAKYDLSEADHSVLLHKRILKLFCTVSRNEKGLECHWTYSSLSQGLTWSPR